MCTYLEMTIWSHSVVQKGLCAQPLLHVPLGDPLLGYMLWRLPTALRCVHTPHDPPPPPPAPRLQMASVCANALRFGNIVKARELLEKVSDHAEGHLPPAHPHHARPYHAHPSTHPSSHPPRPPTHPSPYPTLVCFPSHVWSPTCNKSCLMACWCCWCCCCCSPLWR